MDVDEAQGSAKTRAWMAGGALGVLGGVVASGVGIFAGMCCLLQFANVLVPAGVGLVAGTIAGGAAPWANLKGVGSVGLGAGLGARAGFMSAFVSGAAGLAFSQLFQIGMVVNAISTDEVGAALTMWAVGVATGLGFMAAGVLIGALLGTAGGALAGMIFGE